MAFKKEICLLATSQAIQSTIIAGALTTAALASHNLLQANHYPLQWATLPSALLFFAALLSTFFLSRMMAVKGRKAGFYFGTLLGVAGHGLAAYAISQNSFLLFCLSMTGQGIFLASSFYYRFAAMDVAASSIQTTSVTASSIKIIKAREANAIAWVLAGSTLAAFTGPNLANWSASWTLEGWSLNGLAHGPVQRISNTESIQLVINATTQGVSTAPTYIGNYFVYVGLSLLTLFVIFFLAPATTTKPRQPTPFEKSRLRQQPVFVTAVIVGLGSYLIMSLIMNATPLAMRHDHSLKLTALVIQWHIFAMYAPSFFTGRLINQLHAKNIIKIGLLLCLMCIGLNTLDAFNSLTEHKRYLISLFFLGIGWNFLFVSATYLLGQSYTATTKAYAQGVNDVFVFIAITLATLSAGWLEASLGYTWVNLLAIPVVVLLWWVVRSPASGQTDSPAESPAGLSHDSQQALSRKD